MEDTTPASPGARDSLGLTAPDERRTWPITRRLLTKVRPRPGQGLLVELALLALVVAWFFLLRPQNLGGPVGYVIVSGQSMEPTLHSGDLVLVRQRESYQVGDVIAYRIPRGEPGEGIIVVHRIVGGSAEEGFVTRGDNRTGADLWRPRPQDIAGALWLHLPRVGWLLGLLRAPLVLATAAAVVAVLLVLTSPARKRRA